MEKLGLPKFQIRGLKKLAPLLDLIIPIILALREGLEAVLVIILIFLYLKKTKQQIYKKYIYLGSFLAVISSILFAIIITVLIGSFTGILEKLFEGYTFVVSGIFVITLIIWISREGPTLKSQIEGKVEQSIKKEKLFALISLSFFMIIREGIELVLILTGVQFLGALEVLSLILGTLIGLISALFIGILVYYGIKKISLSKFFKITNFVLILFAVGLITYGVHEFIEAGALNPIIDPIWNIKTILPENFPDGNPLTHESFEIIGSILKALFGYNANPALLELLVYITLLGSIGISSLYLWKNGDKLRKIKLSKVKIFAIIAILLILLMIPLLIIRNKIPLSYSMKIDSNKKSTFTVQYTSLEGSKFKFKNSNGTISFELEAFSFDLTHQFKIFSSNPDTVNYILSRSDYTGEGISFKISTDDSKLVEFKIPLITNLEFNIELGIESTKFITAISTGILKFTLEHSDNTSVYAVELQF